MPPRLVELYYTAEELCLLLRVSKTWIRERIRSGDFGPGVFRVGDRARIPASGVNAYLERVQIPVPAGIAARTEGELRRRAARAD